MALRKDDTHKPRSETSFFFLCQADLVASLLVDLLVCFSLLLEALVMCYFIDILANPCTCRNPLLKIAMRRAKHVATMLVVSSSGLVGWVSRTREGGKTLLPASRAVLRAFGLTSERPSTCATYKYGCYI